MKTIRRKSIIALIMIIIAMCLSSVIMLVLNNTNIVFAAESSTKAVGNEVSKEVYATYTFVPLNDTECNVKIANKSEATKANIPMSATIDGKKYTVTEVALNGFMGASKLTSVILPRSLKVIRNSAFANCAELTEINLSQVEEIGNYAFMKCPKLQQLIIPSSVTTINNAILRNNDTKVMCAVEQAGEGWSTNWNSYNSNQVPEYGCSIYSTLVYDPLYTSEESDTPIAYSVSGVQNKAISNISMLSLNDEEDYEIEGDTIFIPATYKDGNPIVKIDMDSFMSLEEEKDKLIVEFSER